jgi:hypothetical protein
MGFRRFIDDVESRELTLQVVNRTELDPVYGILEDTFEGQDVTVVEATDEDAPETRWRCARPARRWRCPRSPTSGTASSPSRTSRSSC